MPVETRFQRCKLEVALAMGTNDTKVTLVSENVTIPPFTGHGPESVHAFVRRVKEECTRRSANTDAEKIATLKARICFESTSLAGKLVKSDKFLQFDTFDEFTTALCNHFAGHSKLGATHSLLKVAQSATQIVRSTSDTYKAENIASSLSSELTTQLKDSTWFTDEKMSSANFQRLMSYFLFVLQLDSPTFAVASDIELKPSDFIYDVCKKISEKSPPASQPIHLAQPVAQGSSSRCPSPQSVNDRSSGRSRPAARQFQQTRQQQPRYRSQSRHSRDRNVTCHRCGLRGHISAYCRVTLDESGIAQYNPDAYCPLHDRRGHSLTDCRLHQKQMALRQPSGNASRPNQHEFT